MAGAAIHLGWVGAAALGIAWAVGCSQAELIEPPERPVVPTGEVVASDDCPTAPVPLCAPMPLDAGGCVAEPEPRDGGAARISATQSFPVGCVVNIPATYTTPQGECLVAWACRCAKPGAQADAGESQWDCVR